MPPGPTHPLPWLLALATSLISTVAAATLSAVPETAGPLDLAAWQFRQPVLLRHGPVHRLALELETLARARANLGDLRLVRGTNQVPYLWDPEVTEQRVAPTVTVTGDPKRPGVSRWQLQLPHPQLPLRTLVCQSPTTLFQRHLELSEEVRDPRNGAKYRRVLGQAHWSRLPGESPRALSLRLDHPPETATLRLETDNGDNPPLALETVAFVVPTPRLWFKLTGPADDLFLYFGNPEASPPAYDLGLLAAEVRAAPKTDATLGPVQPLRPGAFWRLRDGAASAGFWIVLAGVAAALLALIVRLLPEAGTGTTGGPPEDPGKPA
jgi:hypothetical protein